MRSRRWAGRPPAQGYIPERGPAAESAPGAGRPSAVAASLVAANSQRGLTPRLQPKNPSTSQHPFVRPPFQEMSITSTRQHMSWISQEMMRQRTSGPYENYGEMLYAESLEGLARRRQKVRPTDQRRHQPQLHSLSGSAHRRSPPQLPSRAPSPAPCTWLLCAQPGAETCHLTCCGVPRPNLSDPRPSASALSAPPTSCLPPPSSPRSAASRSSCGAARTARCPRGSASARVGGGAPREGWVVGLRIPPVLLDSRAHLLWPDRLTPLPSPAYSPPPPSCLCSQEEQDRGAPGDAAQGEGGG
jgi:hypothetical protein